VEQEKRQPQQPFVKLKHPFVEEENDTISDSDLLYNINVQLNVLEEYYGAAYLSST
jgi:hypothetical protein